MKVIDKLVIIALFITFVEGLQPTPTPLPYVRRNLIGSRQNTGSDSGSGSGSGSNSDSSSNGSSNSNSSSNSDSSSKSDSSDTSSGSTSDSSTDSKSDSSTSSDSKSDSSTDSKSDSNTSSDSKSDSSSSSNSDSSSPSSSSSNTVTESSSPSNNNNNSSDNNGLGTGGIIGIAVGVGVAAIAIAGIIIWRCVKKRYSDIEDDEDNQDDIKWPQLRDAGGPSSTALQPLPARPTGGAGIEMESSYSNPHPTNETDDDLSLGGEPLSTASHSASGIGMRSNSPGPMFAPYSDYPQPQPQAPPHPQYFDPMTGMAYYGAGNGDDIGAAYSDPFASHSNNGNHNEVQLAPWQQGQTSQTPEPILPNPYTPSPGPQIPPFNLHSPPPHQMYPVMYNQPSPPPHGKI